MNSFTKSRSIGTGRALLRDLFPRFFLNLRRLRDHDAAYRNIPFEKEALERQAEIASDLDDYRRT
jgi:hypothetical protein